MPIERLSKIRVCCPLLGQPAQKVVEELVDELEHMYADLSHALLWLTKCKVILEGEYPEEDDRHPELSGLNKVIAKLDANFKEDESDM